MCEETENKKDCKDCKHFIPIEGNLVFSGYCQIGVKELEEQIGTGTCSKFEKRSKK